MWHSIPGFDRWVKRGVLQFNYKLLQELSEALLNLDKSLNCIVIANWSSSSIKMIIWNEFNSSYFGNECNNLVLWPGDWVRHEGVKIFYHPEWPDNDDIHYSYILPSWVDNDGSHNLLILLSGWPDEDYIQFLNIIPSWIAWKQWFSLYTHSTILNSPTIMVF